MNMKKTTTVRTWTTFKRELLSGPVDTNKAELDKHWKRLTALGSFIYQWHIIPSQSAAGVFRLALHPPGLDPANTRAVREFLFTSEEVAQALDERTHEAVFFRKVQPEREKQKRRDGKSAARGTRREKARSLFIAKRKHEPYATKDGLITEVASELKFGKTAVYGYCDGLK